MARAVAPPNGITLPPHMIAAEAQHHPSRTPASAFENAARALIVRTLLLEEAARRGLAATPCEVGQGKRELQDEAQIRLLLETCIPFPDVPEADCLTYYQKSNADFQSPEHVEVSHILFAADRRDADAVAKAQAAALAASAELAQQPGLFETLARERSDCGSKSVGGRLGQLAAGETVPEFEAALAVLKPGEITPLPVKSRFGFHLIRLDARMSGQRLPFEYVREKIEAFLGERAWRRGVAAFIGRLVESADIEGIEMDPTRRAAS